jgi:hypothetical protein
MVFDDGFGYASFCRTEVEDLARKLSIKLYRTCVKDNVLIDDGT